MRTPQEWVEIVDGAIEDLENAMSEWDQAVSDETTVKSHLRVQKAQAWRQVQGKSREEREAYVAADVTELQMKADMAEHRAKRGLENVRNKRAILSARQTSTNVVKEDSQYSRLGPDHSGG